MSPVKRARMLIRFGESHPGLAFLLAFISLVLAVTALGVGYVYPRVQATTNAQHQQQELAETMCGGFVQLSHEPITDHTSQLGRGLIEWARAGAHNLHCPMTP